MRLFIYLSVSAVGYYDADSATNVFFLLLLLLLLFFLFLFFFFFFFFKPGLGRNKYGLSCFAFI